jgi:uncharacterized protein
VPLPIRDKPTFAALLRTHFAISWHGFHGAAHWARVARNGRELCRREPAANPRVVHLFALLHDLRRQDEGRDIEHGPRAAAFIREIADEHLLLDPGELDRLCEACIGHSEGETSADPTIAACWDADRFDLGRVGKYPRPELLSLPAARDRALIAWAHRAATGWLERAPGSRTGRGVRYGPPW